jgi:hypothetical protein
MPVDLEHYRRQLEDMMAEAIEEQYRHGAGLKRTLELSPIYERYADLTTLDQARALDEMDAPVELRRFAAETYLGDAVKELVDQAGNLESSLTVPLGDQEIPYLAVRPRIVNEPDAAIRRELWRARTEVTDRELNPVLRETAEREREQVQVLGADTTLALYERLGFDPVALRADTEVFLDETEALYVTSMDRALRDRLGMGLEDAGPQDLARLWRAPEFDRLFPAERSVAALRETLAGLGIDLDRQANVEIDLDEREGKQPRAFCAPVRVPGRVILVVLPQGGHDDYKAIFHEAGHVEHFANTSASMPAEDRVLGDSAVTEGWAFLFEHLVSDPTWLAARLDAPRPDDYVRFDALNELFLARRYSAKLAYEVELHSGAELDGLPERYAAHLTAATCVPYPPQDHLTDVDPGFYCTYYLRAWALESHLSQHLRERFGRDWFRRREAGMLLRELWELGQSLTAEQLLRELTGARLEFGVIADHLRERLED